MLKILIMRVPAQWRISVFVSRREGGKPKKNIIAPFISWPSDNTDLTINTVFLSSITQKEIENRIFKIKGYSLYYEREYY